MLIFERRPLSMSALSRWFPAAIFLALIPTPTFGQAAVFDSPEQLWRDFDPESPELEISVSKTWQEGRASFEKLRFTAERESGGKVRVFAIRGAPFEGSRLPGILHIHGGGQTASLDWVRFWVKRGYVCASYDFTGPWAGRKEFTDWGPITQANLAQAHGGFTLRPTVRASAWYHWALVARRALTLLSDHPKVDRSRLGIFGVSIGGSLCWIVAGTDERVKTSVPIYGCGYNYDRRKTNWGFPEPNRDVLLFQRMLAPEAYAASIRSPVLLLDATNDFHGWMDDAYRIQSQTHATCRLAFTPRYNHHIEAEEAANLPAWMDWQLRGGPAFPAEPKLELRLDGDGDPLADVRHDEALNVPKVEVFYAMGEKPPPNRFWRRAVTVRTKTGWQAKLPVINTSDTLRAFANVFYQPDVCLSTNLARAVPDRLGRARPTLAWSAAPTADGSEPGAPFVFAAANTDPDRPMAYFVRSDERADREAVCVNPALFGGDRIKFAIVSHYIGDPGYVGRDGLSLAFEYQGEFVQDDPPVPAGGPNKSDVVARGFTVQVTAHDWTPRAQRYAAHIDPKLPTTGKTGWRRVTLSVSQFVSADRKPLASWRDLDKIEIRGVTTKRHPPRFVRLKWVSR